jgi:hypothetical protein
MKCRKGKCIKSKEESIGSNEEKGKEEIEKREMGG